MKTIQIPIPDMQSNHCQLRVEKAIQSNTQARIEQIMAGSAKVTVANETDIEQVINAIRNAGYTVGTTESQSPAEGGLRFKTTIHCGGCLSKVAPALNGQIGVGNWQVDTNSPDKILTLNAGNISPETVIRIVREAGYQIELIS